MLNEYSTCRDVLRFAGSQGDREWVYIITGRPGPTGKTFLCNKLKENGYNSIEISEDTGRSVKYFGDRNTFNVNYEKKQVVIVLNRLIYTHGSNPWKGRNEIGPAWDGFRAGVAEAECEIHGGFTTYPKSLFVLPLSQQKLKPKIKDVIFNEPATIVYWSDGTKTVVKTQEGEKYDPEKGLAMAISKKALGNKHDYYHTFLHWLKEYDKKYYWKAEMKNWPKQSENHE